MAEKGCYGLILSPICFFNVNNDLTVPHNRHIRIGQSVNEQPVIPNFLDRKAHDLEFFAGEEASLGNIAGSAGQHAVIQRVILVIVLSVQLQSAAPFVFAIDLLPGPQNCFFRNFAIIAGVAVPFI